MFWIGITIALVSGVLSIDSVCERFKSRAPWLAKHHVDTLLFVLLVVGLTLSSVDHISDESEKLIIRDLYATLEVRFSGEWSKNPYPEQIISPVNDQFYVYLKRDQDTISTDVMLFATEPYQFTKIGPSSAKFVVRQRVHSDEFPIGQKRDALSEFNSVGIFIPFLVSSDFHSPKIVVQDLNLVLSLNGASGKPIRIKSPIDAPVRIYNKSKKPWANFEIPIHMIDHLPKI